MKKGNLSIKYYIPQIKNLVDALQATWKTIPTRDHILHILSGLGSEYESTIYVIIANIGSISIQ